MVLTSLCIALLVFTQSLFCMENSRHDLATIGNDILTNQIKSNVSFFSHDIICALALVNKHLNKAVEKSAAQRKIYLATQHSYCNLRQQNSAIYNQTTWHKYNSAYAYWRHCEFVMTNGTRPITFNLVHFNGNNNSISHHILYCLPTDEYASHPIFESYRPFFNSKGDACFHAQGRFDLQEGAEDSAIHSPSFRPYIFEYSINTKGTKAQLPCYVDIDDKNDPNKKFCLTNCFGLIKNPTLLQKILNSKSVTESSPTTYDLESTIYDKHGPYRGNIKVYSYDNTEPCKDSVLTLSEISAPKEFSKFIAEEYTKLIKNQTTMNATITEKVISNEPVIFNKELNDRLIEAANTDNINEVIVSIDAGATSLGKALIRATKNSNFRITELLLRAMDDQNVTLNQLETLMIIDGPASNGYEGMIEFLFTKMPTLATEKNINSAIAAASRSNYNTTINFLIAKAQSLHLSINFDKAFNELTHDGNIDEIKFLFTQAQALKIIPNLNLAFKTAISKGHQELIQLLAAKIKDAHIAINFTKAHEIAFFDDNTRDLLSTLEKQSF